MPSLVINNGLTRVNFEETSKLPSCKKALLQQTADRVIKQSEGKELHLKTLPRSYSFTEPKQQLKEILVGKKQVLLVSKYIRHFLGDALEKDVKELVVNSVLEARIENELKNASAEDLELFKKIEEMRQLIGYPIMWAKEGNDFIWKDETLGMTAFLKQDGDQYTLQVLDLNGEVLLKSVEAEKKSIKELTAKLNTFRIDLAAKKVGCAFYESVEKKQNKLAKMVGAIKTAGLGLDVAERSMHAGGALKLEGISESCHIAAIAGLPLDVYRFYLAKRRLEQYREHKIEIEKLLNEGRFQEVELLQKKATLLLHSAAGKIFFSTTSTLATFLQSASAVTEIACAAIGSHSAAAATAVTATGCAGGAVLAASSCVSAIVNTFRFYKKAKRKELIEDTRNSVLSLKTKSLINNDLDLFKKCQSLERFLRMQRKIVHERMLFKTADMGVDVALCSVGALMVAAAAAGAPSAGIGAGAVAGGVVLGIAGLIVADRVRKKRRLKKEKRLRVENPALSKLGIIVELSELLAKEKLHPEQDQSATKLICGSYLGIPRDLVLSATEGLVEKYKQACRHHVIA